MKNTGVAIKKVFILKKLKETWCLVAVTEVFVGVKMQRNRI